MVTAFWCCLRLCLRLCLCKLLCFGGWLREVKLNGDRAGDTDVDGGVITVARVTLFKQEHTYDSALLIRFPGDSTLMETGPDFIGNHILIRPIASFVCKLAKFRGFLAPASNREWGNPHQFRGSFIGAGLSQRIEYGPLHRFRGALIILPQDGIRFGHGAYLLQVVVSGQAHHK